MSESTCFVCDRELKAPAVASAIPTKFISQLFWFTQAQNTICPDCLHLAASLILAGKGGRATVRRRVIARVKEMRARGVKTVGDETKYYRDRGLLFR